MLSNADNPKPMKPETLNLPPKGFGPGQLFREPMQTVRSLREWQWELTSYTPDYGNPAIGKMEGFACPVTFSLIESCNHLDPQGTPHTLKNISPTIFKVVGSMLPLMAPPRKIRIRDMATSQHGRLPFYIRITRNSYCRMPPQAPDT